jgi:hypothetical protein
VKGNFGDHLEKCSKVTYYMFCPSEKNNITHCKNQRHIGILCPCTYFGPFRGIF